MKININDLFDFSDFGDINKLEKKVKELDTLLSKFSDNLQKNIDDNVKSLEKWGKQIDSLNVSIEKEAALIIQLERNISSLTQKQDKLKSNQEKVNATRKETVAQANKAKQSLTELEKVEKKLADATGQEAQELAKLRLQLAEANKQTKLNAKESLGLVSAYDKLAQETAAAKREAKNLGATLGKESLEFKAAAQRANDLNQQLKDIDAGVGDFQRNVGNYSSALDGVKQGFSSVLELATPAGLAIAAVGLAVEGIGALAETVKETNDQLRETAQLTGLSGQALDDYTAKVRATSKTFDQEYKEVLKASNTLSKEFGISGSEALDLINNGFIQGANINDDYLEQLKEYSTQFKQAGLSAQDFNNVVALGAKEGIFGDKAADTVKEGGLRLREFTKATKDALIPLGKLRNEEIQQAVASGNSFKAIQLVSKGLKEVSLDAQQTQGIITNVFGGPGEDAGLRFIQLLSDIDTGQKTVLDNLTEQQKRQLKVLEVEQELAAAEVKLGEAFKGVGNDFAILGKQLQTLGIEGVVAIIDELKATFNELSIPFNAVVEQVEELGNKFEGGGEGILSFIKKFNPITFLFQQFTSTVKGLLFAFEFLLNFINDSIDSIVAVGTQIKQFATSFEFVNSAIEKTKSIYSSFLQVIADTPKFFNGLKEAGKQSFTELASIAKQTLTGTKDLILALFSFDVDTIKAAFNKSIPKFQESGKEVAEAFRRGFNSVDVVKVDEKKVEETKKEAEKTVKKEAAAKVPEKEKKSKEQKEKEELDKRLQLIEESAKDEELLLKQQLLNKQITEEEFAQKSIELQLATLEKRKELLKEFNKDITDEEIKQTDILLSEQERLAKEEEKRLKKAEKEKKDAKAKTDKEEADRRKKQQEQASDPIAQATFDALETRIENELLLAGVQAFRASIERGDETQTALQNGLKAVAAAQVFKSLAKNSGFHDGGYTGDGYEHDVAGVVHKGEFVNTKQQTSKYNMKGWKASDFDDAVKTGYFNQFSEIDNRIGKETSISKQLIVNNNNKVLVDAINELPKKMPKTDLSFYGKDLQQRVKEGNITRKTTFRSVR